jgi:DNA-binding Lrp family transcriptional regulator
VNELWDLLRILNTGSEFVLGSEVFGRWANFEKALPVVKGEENPPDEREAWEWVRNPLPPAREHPLFATLRLHLGVADDRFFTDRGFGSLDFLEQQALGEALEPGFLREHNPIVRHTVLRRRRTLEEAGLLERIGVEIHPDPHAPPGTYRGVSFRGVGLVTNHPFDLAYQAAEAFTEVLRKALQGSRFHEEPALAAHLLELRIRPLHRRKDAPARAAGRRRSAA